MHWHLLHWSGSGPVFFIPFKLPDNRFLKINHLGVRFYLMPILVQEVSVTFESLHRHWAVPLTGVSHTVLGHCPQSALATDARLAQFKAEMQGTTFIMYR